MRAQTIGGFALGFACGMLALSLSLVFWRSGTRAESAVPEPQTAHTGLRLSMPVAGVKAADVADTFHDPRNGRRHEALNIPAPRGTPVRAVASGTVAKLFNSKPGGLTVYQFDETRTYCFYYAHLDGYAPDLKEGRQLRAGDTIGYVGTTGNAPKDVPHLHFAVLELGPDKKWWKGQPIDPLPLLK